MRNHSEPFAVDMDARRVVRTSGVSFGHIAGHLCASFCIYVLGCADRYVCYRTDSHPLPSYFVEYYYS